MNDLEAAGRFEWERVVLRVKMPATTKLVALTIAAHANRKGENAHPGEHRLALIVGIDPRHVREHVRRLEKELRLIVLRKHGGGGGGRRRTANEYALVIPNDLLQRAEIADLDGTNTGTSTSGDSAENTGTPGSGDSARTPDVDDGTPDVGDMNTGPLCQNTGTPASSQQGSNQAVHQPINHHAAAWPPPLGEPRGDDVDDEELNDAHAILDGLPPDKLQELLTYTKSNLGEDASTRELIVSAARIHIHPGDLHAEAAV